MKHRRSPCHDCGTDTTPETPNDWQYYMVHDTVWAAAGMGRRGYLCVPCIEHRLARPLTPADLADVMINLPAELDTPYLRNLKASA